MPGQYRVPACSGRGGGEGDPKARLVGRKSDYSQ